MAFASDNRTTTIALGDRFNAMMASFAETRAKRKVYKDTVRELNSLTNRELADIGINRSLIRAVALDAARNV